MHFSSFGMKLGNAFSIEHFSKALMQNDPINITPAKDWSNDEWWIDQDDREFIPTEGFNIINQGHSTKVSGKIIGGNISAFGALQGTEYFPILNSDTILFLEECQEQTSQFFDRLLQSLIYQEGFENVKAIFIGRFEKKNKMTPALLKKIIKSKPELDHLPVISNMDFGHTTPMITYPIGGKCQIDLKDGLKITISE